MKQYIDSQEQWEDSVNADHDKRNERTKEQIDNRVEEYSCTETKPVIMKTYEELKAEASKIGVIAPESPGKAPIPTRQLCKRCMKYSGITFWTPDETWKRVTDDRYQHLCLPCFVDMADERMIDWEPIDLRREHGALERTSGASIKRRVHRRRINGMEN